MDEKQRKAAEDIIKIAAEVERRRKRRKIYTFYPDTGPLRRELYRPQMEFFRAGSWARERAIIAANGIGKTEGVGGYELVLHLTGNYPEWWQGRRFKEPISAWVAGDTNQTVKEIIQTKLVGLPGAEGTGIIPGDLIPSKHIKKKAGLADAIESLMVKHRSGGLSYLGFKSYEQGRKSFQGTEKHLILLDEEPPDSVYDECLMRTRTVDGMIMLTFTPIMGLTNVVLKFMPNGIVPEGGRTGLSRYVVNATWEHAPHLTEKEKEEILDGTLPHLKDARSKGEPTMGAGVIYPVVIDDITVPDFEIPPWFTRAYALDTGWKATAALWGARDRESDIIYFYSCYKQGHAEPATHVRAVKSRGDWMSGVGDYAGTSQLDGKKVIDEFRGLGLDLHYPDKHIEAGIFSVWERMVSGRLKIFESLTPLINEIRIYRRDENGQVAKDQDDHLCDCMRYFCMTGIYVMTLPPFDLEEEYIEQRAVSNAGTSAGYFGLY